MEQWVYPTEEHIKDLGDNMRPMDILEVQGFSGLNPYDGLRDSIKYSVECGAWLVDGRVACMAGIAKKHALDDIAMPWLLSSKLVPMNSRRFLRGTKMFVDSWKEKYPYMMNFVHADYEDSIRWLRWLGFTVHDNIVVHNEEPFRLFEMRT